MHLPEDLFSLLNAASTAYVATIMRDGSPQLTQVWIDTDGEHVVINSVDTHLKVRNLRRDPRVAVTVSDPDNPRRYFQVRGRVVDITAEGGAEHIDKLAHKYTGRPYTWWGGRDQTRVILTVEVEKVMGVGG